MRNNRLNSWACAARRCPLAAEKGGLAYFFADCRRALREVRAHLAGRAPRPILGACASTRSPQRFEPRGAQRRRRFLRPLAQVEPLVGEGALESEEPRACAHNPKPFGFNGSRKGILRLRNWKPTLSDWSSDADLPKECCRHTANRQSAPFNSHHLRRSDIRRDPQWSRWEDLV